MTDRPEGTSRPRAFSAQDRRLVLALVAVLVVVFALVGSNVAASHSPKPHDVPVGVVGTPPVTGAASAALRTRAPGAYRVHEYTSLAPARTAILHRTVYGAYRPLPSPELLVASAASPTVAGLLEQTAGAGVNRSSPGETVPPGSLGAPTDSGKRSPSLKSLPRQDRTPIALAPSREKDGVRWGPERPQPSFEAHVYEFEPRFVVARPPHPSRIPRREGTRLRLRGLRRRALARPCAVAVAPPGEREG